MSCSLKFRFTDFDGMSYSGYHIYNAASWKLNALTLQDCTANSGTFEMENSGATANTIVFRNNLFERSTCNFQNDLDLNLRNNLWKGGATYFLKLATNDWNITDNAFDRCAVEEDFPGSSHSHNAYIATDGRLNSIDPTDPHDIVLTNFNYVSGALGNFYQLSTNLINKGSDTATNAGLYHYTVLTNQVPETNSIVDIGFHYVALGTNGLPLDADTNNVPDYAADREYRQNGGGNSGGPHVNEWSPNDSGHSNKLWVEIIRNIIGPPATNGTITNIFLNLALHNTHSNLFYQIQTKTNLKELDWTPSSIFTNTIGLTNIVYTNQFAPTNQMMSFRAVGSDTLVSISRLQDAIEPHPTNGFTAQVGEFLIQRTNINGDLSAPLTVFFRTSGTASNGVDYTDGSTALTNFVTFTPNFPNVSVFIVPEQDDLIELDETVTLSLVPTTNYVILPGTPPVHFTGAVATITISDPAELLFTEIAQVTGPVGPVGMDYHLPTRSLLFSINPAQAANAFSQIDSNGVVSAWSSILGPPNEIKIVTVKDVATNANEMFFTNGAMFFGNDKDIGWLSANGAVSNMTWAVLTNSLGTNDTLLRGSLYVDRSGVFNGDLIAVTGGATGDEGGQVWRIDREQRIPSLFANITNDPVRHLEGVITLPNDVDKWGPWAGKILTGGKFKNPPLIHAIDTNGVVKDFALGIAPEDFDIIATNQDLYCCCFQTGVILKLSKTLFTNDWGNLLITQAGEGGSVPRPDDTPRIFVVRWDTTQSFVITKSISRQNRGEFEHVTFAPIDIPPLP